MKNLGRITSTTDTTNKNYVDNQPAISIIDDNSTNATKIWSGSLAQYNAIVTKDNNTVYYITDDGGAVNGGGNPTGTIISFMGATAPTGYLICDGSTVNISDYSVLASFFETQFGSKNYFGGDGTTTFALPDLRNEFLRGYHCGNSEQLSGNIGIHQDATQHPRNVANNTSGRFQYQGESSTNYTGATNMDKQFKNSSHVWNEIVRTNSGSDANASIWYSSRPTNVAVLFCIKY